MLHTTTGHSGDCLMAWEKSRVHIKYNCLIVQLFKVVTFGVPSQLEQLGWSSKTSGVLTPLRLSEVDNGCHHIMSWFYWNHQRSEKVFSHLREVDNRFYHSMSCCIGIFKDQRKCSYTSEKLTTGVITLISCCWSLLTPGVITPLRF